jgi:hypothetical protein
VGVAMGGYLSDRLVNRLGISARALVLATSQVRIIISFFRLIVSKFLIACVDDSKINVKIYFNHRSPKAYICIA